MQSRTELKHGMAIALTGLNESLTDLYLFCHLRYEVCCRVNGALIGFRTRQIISYPALHICIKQWPYALQYAL